MTGADRPRRTEAATTPAGNATTTEAHPTTEMSR
jgi:hypothetical protein